MGSLVTPTTYLVGHTVMDMLGMADYLSDTGNGDFMRQLHDAREAGIAPGEALCSFYAKLCYASLTEGHNLNITRTRSIEENVKSTLAHGHGSVFEHCWLNFVTHNCSRVFTHELVRHRVGTAFSQTSGRYVRTDELDVVWDPILEPIRAMCEGKIRADEAWYSAATVMMGLASVELAQWFIDNANEYEAVWKQVKAAGYVLETDTTRPKGIFGLKVVSGPSIDFAEKKKRTSALRRFLPNGQANEMGWSVNLRALRHLLQLRTSRGAEYEIRKVFGDVYQMVKARYPLMFADAKEEMVDGLLEVTGLKIQPYDFVPEVSQ